MSRKLAHISLVLALVGLIAGPAGAGNNRKSTAPITYFMNWDGDCTGGGYLSLTAAPNEAGCSQYLPGTDRSHKFRASGQAPFFLDATRPIAVDFEVDHIVSGAAEFEVLVEATIGNQTRVIASGAQSVTAETAWEPTAFHYDLEPDASLHLAKVSYPVVTVTWSDGATWSSIDTESGTATVAFNGAKSSS